MSKHLAARIGWLSAIGCLAPVAAWALITPRFTPIHLSRDSETILLVKCGGGDIADKADLVVVEAVKGVAPAGVTVNLSKAAEEHAVMARKVLKAAAGDKILLFSCAHEGEQVSFLHVRGTWLRLNGKGKTLDLEAVDDKMLGTWNGGTDMLLGCIRYILDAKEQAVVPADFDGDGWLDVLSAGADGVKIFQNTRNGDFVESMDLSGEVAYKAQPNVSWCGTCDFNNDGRQDIFLTYAAQPLLLYFNRGFRSFGQAPSLEMSLANQIKGLDRGQQAGLFADLSGRGAEDFVLVTAAGEIWLAANALGERDALAVKPQPKFSHNVTRTTLVRRFARRCPIPPGTGGRRGR
jgi:hypothetical protein